MRWFLRVACFLFGHYWCYRVRLPNDTVEYRACLFCESLKRSVTT